MRRRQFLHSVPPAVLLAGCSGQKREGWVEAVPVSEPPGGADRLSLESSCVSEVDPIATAVRGALAEDRVYQLGVSGQEVETCSECLRTTPSFDGDGRVGGGTFVKHEDGIVVTRLVVET